MKTVSVLVLIASFLGCANADANCSKFIGSEDYLFSYDGCILEVEKSNGSDFYLYNIKRKADSGRPLLTMYQGSAPDVRDFLDDKEEIIEREIEK